MAFLQAGLRESRRTRSRSPYPRPLVLDTHASHEGRYASLLERPSPPMSIIEGQLVQRKFSASSVHSVGLDSLSGMSSGSNSVSLSDVGLFIYLFSAYFNQLSIHCGRQRTRNPRGLSSNPSSDWESVQNELECLLSRNRELEQANQKLELDKRVLEAKNSTLQ